MKVDEDVLTKTLQFVNQYRHRTCVHATDEAEQASDLAGITIVKTQDFSDFIERVRSSSYSKQHTSSHISDDTTIPSSLIDRIADNTRFYHKIASLSQEITESRDRAHTLQTKLDGIITLDQSKTKLSAANVKAARDALRLSIDQGFRQVQVALKEDPIMPHKEFDILLKDAKDKVDIEAQTRHFDFMIKTGQINLNPRP